MDNNISYQIYPSLLDKFQQYIDIDESMEQPWNFNKSKIQIEMELFDSIFKSINKEYEEGEAAEKGTCFNNVIDWYINGRKMLYDGNVLRIRHVSKSGNVYHFEFNKDIVEYFGRYFQNSISQVFVSTVIPTKFGNVRLYGYTDELKYDTVFDIKTTRSYEFGKFIKYWQRYLYPLCLCDMGIKVSGFEFTITDFSDYYKEYYTFEYSHAKEKLINFCEHFIYFLELNRDKIINKKIFNGTDARI